MDREALGRIVRRAWVQYCIETGDTKESHLVPWEQLAKWDKEADMRIGEAVADAYREYSEGLLREQEQVIHMPTETHTVIIRGHKK